MLELELRAASGRAKESGYLLMYRLHFWCR